MRRTAFLLISTILIGAFGARADDPPSPAFERIKALGGEWEGTARAGESEKSVPTVAVYRVVSNGSAVMLVTDPGTTHEMITMFHRDGAAVLATHYCAAMNQPRLRLQAPANVDRLEFAFLDGTNLAAHPGRMDRLVLDIAAPDHHRQEWTFRDGGQDAKMVMELRRKTGPQPAPAASSR